ncbi:MAG: AAA family ATPase, partial [Acidobacteriota bacterium]
MIGRTVSHYRVIASLGSGGMGEVYRAEDTRLGRQVALKVLPETLTTNPKHLSRFKREATTLAALNHPNIVTIFSVEEVEGLRFMTMELVAGATLEALLPAHGFGLDRFFSLAIPIAGAVAAAHDRGIIHRDLKPANVMVAGEGDDQRVKVLDFGLAKASAAGDADTKTRELTVTATQAGTILGTPHYMSPEQARGEQIDHRSDLFSLGVVLFEMVTGRRPFQGNSSIELLSAILKDRPPSLTEIQPELPRHLGRVIGRCLEKAPADRYQTARDVFNELRALKAETTAGLVSVPPVSSSPAARDHSSSIAVWRLRCRTEDSEIVEFAEGLADDITAGLARFPYLSVIGRDAILGQDDRDAAVRDLGVRYLIEGSVRKGGPRVRVSLQLVDATSGTHLWTETYDRSLDSDDLDLFAAQDEITDRVVATVADGYGVLVRALASEIPGKADDELTGSDWVLQMFGYRQRIAPREHRALRNRLEQAAEHDPESVEVWASLAQLYLDEASFGFNLRRDADDALVRALQAARRAVEIDPTDQLACQMLAQVQFFRRDLESFRANAERAMALNPLDTNTLGILGLMIVHTGEFERGAEITRRAMALNPHHAPFYHFGPIWEHFHEGRWEKALRRAKQAHMPGQFWPYLVIAAACGHLGRLEEAERAVESILELDPEFAASARDKIEVWHFASGLIEPLLEGLRKAGMSIPAVAGIEATPTAEGESERRSARRPLVGRESERAELVRLLESAGDGRGGLVLLGGEAGVGKTRLANETLEDGRERGMMTLTGHAREDESAPFVVMTEVLEDLLRQSPRNDLGRLLAGTGSEIVRLLPELRRLVPDLPEPIDAPPEQQRRLLFKSVLEILGRAADKRPLVLLLDDLQWADESSLQLLEHIAPRLAELPILVVGTYRDVEADIDEAFARSMAALVRQRATERLTIKALTEPSVAALLAELGGDNPPSRLVGAIYRNTEGNAFFVEEVYRHLAEEGRLFDEEGRWRSDLDDESLNVPEGVRRVIGHRLDRLQESTRTALTVAAVIGQRFELRVLEAALADPDSTPEALEEAEAAQLVGAVAAGREPVYEFSHALVRQTLLATLSVPRRQQLHIDVATGMTRLFGERVAERAPELATHLSRAGSIADPAELGRYLVAAGDLSLNEAAADEAIHYYDEALACLEETAPEDRAARARILERRARAWRARGDWPSVAADFEASLEISESIGDTERVARICHELGDIDFYANRVEEAVALAERGLAALADDPSVERCRLLADLGCYLSLLGDFDRGDPMLGEAETMADALSDPQLRAAVARQRLVQQHHLMNGSDKLRAAEDAIAMARRSGATWELSVSQGLALVAIVYSGRLGLRARIAEAEELAEELGDAGTLMCVQVASIYEHLNHGRISTAVEQGPPMLAAMKHLGGFLHHGHAHLATALYYAGDWDLAKEHSEAAACDVPRDAWFGFCQAAHLKLLAYWGERDRALKAIDTHAKEIPEVRSEAPIGRWAWGLAAPEVLATFGLHDRAATFHPLLLDVIERGNCWAYNFGLIEKLAGISAACAGLWERAEEHFATALRQSRELPCRVEEPEVLRWHAWAARLRGRPEDRERARALGTEALEVAEDLGMPRHVQMLEAMLRELAARGVEPPRRERTPRRTPLVGRGDERKLLDGMLDDALEGRGGLVLLGGEPGVGKTRLAQEVLDEGRQRGLQVLTGHAYEDDAAPFTMAIEVLDELVRATPDARLQSVIGGDGGELARLLPELRQSLPDLPE